MRDLITILKRNRSVLILLVGLKSYLERKKYYSGDISADHGSTTMRLPLASSIAYIRQVFADFNQYADLSPDRVAGKRMVELGPGDNLGIGLLYLAWGAAEYIGMDRFYSTHDIENERQIYLALREPLSAEEKARFDDAVDLSSGVRFNESKIRYLYGSPAEECDKVLGHASIDIVLGRGVLQSTDIEQSIPAIYRVLKPGGLTSHKVEPRDLGMFSHNGFHPLEFLTVGDQLYTWMVKGAERPNRRHFHDYRRLLQSVGFQFQLLTAAVIDPTLPGFPDTYREVLPHKEKIQLGVDYNQASLDMVRSIRPRLNPRFQPLSDEELMAAAIFFTATKPL